MLNTRRVAAIDIGSNSIHLIVVEAHPGRRFHIIDREKAMVRLAAGTLKTHLISASKMRTAITALKRFVELSNALGANPIIATATSAVREAWNGNEFIDLVEQEVGLKVEVISGIEEARLIALAAKEVNDLQDKKTLVVDIGGGSTEFILLNGKDTELLLSAKLGAVRLQEQFLPKTNIPTSTQLQTVIKYIRNSLVPVVRQIKQTGKFNLAVGTSGTILSLASIALKANINRVEDKSPNFSAPFNLKLSLKSLKILNKQLQKVPLKNRRRIPGLDSRRADIIVAGGILLETILKELSIPEIITCDWSLREGIILDYVYEKGLAWFANDKENTELSWLGSPSVRAKSVLSIAQRYQYESLHSQHTAYLACRLFDEISHLHKLSSSERELLEYSALLHDIGHHISHSSHHKHTSYLIQYSDFPGFHSHEIAIMANVARYHRKSMPKQKHLEFGILTHPQQNIVKKLAAILRIADSLDRRHLGVVKDIYVKTNSKQVIVDALSSKDCELEIWCAEKESVMFESVFRTSFKIQKNKLAN